MTPTLSLPQGMYADIIAHLEAGLPNEACGILSGREGELNPTRFFPATNEAQSKSFYSVAPEDLFRITRAIEQAGEMVWGIVHSHPDTPAYPSDTDIRLAYYPQSYYLIVSFADPARPDLRAFTIREGVVDEVPIIISNNH